MLRRASSALFSLGSSSVRFEMHLCGAPDDELMVTLTGFVEAAFFPGALFLLSKWYTREELGLRTTILAYVHICAPPRFCI